ncbi:uncharacterized protein [Prorops nasuta]|uniref:uncharacterized protein n=1 Tax=Prorops nasuta TaxID=863751 RepID=UPI0034CD8508
MHSEGSEFEHASSRKKPPSFKEMTEFLEGSIQALHSVDLESHMGKSDTQGKASGFNNQRSLVRAHFSGAKNKGNFSQSSSFNTTAMKCPFCSAEHYVGRCEKFRTLNSIERHKEIKRLGLCLNCLGRHQVRNCSSKRSCKKCQGSHHSMLHHDRQHNIQTQQDAGLQNPGTANQENNSGSNSSLRSFASSTLSPFDLTLFSKYRWADPQFYESKEIDLIIGVDIYASILRQGFRQLVGCNIIAQNTALGWIFSGSVNKRNYSDVNDCVRIPRIAAHNSIGGEDLSEILKLFWQIEEVPESKFKLSPQAEFCEKQFATTHLRNSRGRYIVRLPFKAEPPLIASQTRGLAFNSFQALQRKFGRDPELAREYRDFMQKYQTLGHMELVPEGELNLDRAWYLPHHAVIQNGPFYRKIRVVFDA